MAQGRFDETAAIVERVEAPLLAAANEEQVAVADAFAKASPVQRADETLLKEYLRLELKRFIQSKTGSRPVITPVIQKV